MCHFYQNQSYQYIFVSLFEAFYQNRYFIFMI